MEEITKSLNEWNATIEALGQGKQTILIRKYATNQNEFLFYPTFSYALKEGYLESFQNKYMTFAEKNALPKRKGNKIEVKYFAKIEKIIEKPYSRIGTLQKHFIWTTIHVKSYLGGKKAYLWVLRVYKLKKPVMIERTKGIKFSNVVKPISLDGIEPVLTDSEFSQIIQEIGTK